MTILKPIICGKAIPKRSKELEVQPDVLDFTYFARIRAAESNQNIYLTLTEGDLIQFRDEINRCL